MTLHTLLVESNWFPQSTVQLPLLPLSVLWLLGCLKIHSLGISYFSLSFPLVPSTVCAPGKQKFLSDVEKSSSLVPLDPERAE